MSIKNYIDEIITRGIEAARNDYTASDLLTKAKLEGSIEGFEACRNKEPHEILNIFEKARRESGRLHVEEPDINLYWKSSCKAAEIEWVANCISAALVNQGLPPLIPPTVRGMMQAARILGVKDASPVV